MSNDQTNPTRLAIVISHPVQHFVPFYQALAAQNQIYPKVFYASKIGVEPYYDEEMKTEIAWKMDLLSGYEHVFLPEADRIKTSAPLVVNNPSITAELDSFDPGVLLIYGYSQLTMLRALWWSRENNVPAMMIGDSAAILERSGLRQVAKKAIGPALLRQFTCFLTVGDCNENFYRHSGIADDRLFRSPFTIDESAYRAARKDRQVLRAKMRASLAIPETEIIALCVGKLSERKGVRDVIRVAELLKGKSSNGQSVSFLLAGNGELMDELQAETASKSLPVRFAGFINVDELPGIYAAADMIVHPSTMDPHPLVMSEAACIGLPLVVSDRVGAVGPTDIARSGVNTIVVPCGDIEALGEAVSLLSSDATLRNRMSASSIEIFDELDVRCSVAGALRAVDFCVHSSKTGGNLAPDGL